MKQRTKHYLTEHRAVWLIVPLLLLGVFLFQSQAMALTIKVVKENLDAKGKPLGTYSPIAAGFRYIVEEDQNYYVIPGTGTPNAPWTPGETQAQDTVRGNTLAVNIHKSHSPVACTGDTGAHSTVATVNTATNPACTYNPITGTGIDTSTTTINGVILPKKHYVVSVMPWHPPAAKTTDWYPKVNPNGPWFANQAGWGMNGRCVAGNDASVTIVVNPFPNPTAQITVLVFKDTRPINGAYDQPDEVGLGGFSIYLNDIVGKVMQDAWANPIGTTYQVNRTGKLLPNGYNPPIKGANGQYSFVLQDNGLPTPEFIGNGSLTSCSGNATPLNDYERANCIDLDTGAPLAAGEAVIRFIPANKHPIEIIPPANDPGWILTSTLEGTRQNDAWVRFAEPRFNIINGQLNWLVFYGFVKTCDASNGKPCTDTAQNPPLTPGSGSIKGRVVVAHDTHPPLSPGLASGIPAPNCYVGLNNLSGNDEQIYTAPCNSDSTFSISGLSPGTYQLVMWDKEINQIIDFRQVTIPAVGSAAVDLGDVAVYSWFGILQGSVFNDSAGTGMNTSGALAAGQGGISNMRVSARFSDGSAYQSQLTDSLGNYKFTQFFPWWRWMVIQSDQGVAGKNYGRFKSTGNTSIVDQGGQIPAGPYQAFGLNPLMQGGNPYRVDTTSTQTQDMLLFQDMTTIVNWGKKAYAATENGGISGFISYATSRTQEDPQKSFWQSWEAGVPRVTVNLYQAVQACVTYNSTGNVVPTAKICTNNPAACTAAQACQWVPATCTTSGGTLTNCKPVIPTAAAPLTPVATTTTSSFDDNNPTGCVEPATLNTGVADFPIASIPGFGSAGVQIVNGIEIRDCAETFRTWNQVRPGKYDGTYTFPGSLPVGNYIVKAVPPLGYKILKWAERNIEFGEPTAPFQDYPPECVGPKYAVPKFHQLYPDWQIPTMYPGFTQTPTGPVSTWYCKGAVNASGYCAGGTLNPATGPVANDCTMKVTTVQNGQNQIVDFRMFTDVPKAAHMWGWVSDDLHLESNPYSPNASSNFAPSNVPVALLDWMGRTVWRGYTDQWGKFTGDAFSTYYIYAPNPLGMSASLFTVQVNSPGPIVDQSWLKGMPKVCDGTQPAGSKCVTDPFFRPEYGQETIRENWDFYAGTTTFIDTIVIPASAVLSQTPLNCDFVNGTPEIALVDSNGSGPIVGSGATITITAAGDANGNVTVPNPDWNPLLPTGAGNPATITVNHGFGAAQGAGSVTVTGADGVVHALAVTGWAAKVITATVPNNLGSNFAGQLTVTATNPNTDSPQPATLSSTVGVTLHVNFAGKVTPVSPPAANCDPYTDTTHCQRIQPAINAANPGDIISIKPGTYQENPILYKPVTLQGWGAASTVLDGTAALANQPGKDAWSTLFQGLVGAACTASTDCISIPPGQINDFTFEQGAGIMVSACDFTSNTCHNNFSTTPSLIDGLTIRGASEAGGGVYVNSYARGLKITNNLVYANQGNLGGGVRVGSPTITNGTSYTNSHNENMVIANNHIYQNGSLTSGGGGAAMYKGADNYQITSNMFCGNFSNVYGGGIGHYGLSPNGKISKNVIVSNESFDEGGGLHIAGELQIAGAPFATGEGAGSVTINDNLIQGNKGGDDGGALKALKFNGQDIESNPNTPAKWSALTVTNNMMVDNSSGDHGGAIALDDTVFAYIVNNTIARNVSTSTGSGAFTNGACTEGEPLGQFCPPPGEAIGGILPSTPRVGGIASYYHSTAMANVLAGIANAALPANLKLYANPYLYNDILWQNETYFWDPAGNSGFGALENGTTDPMTGITAGHSYWDLAVYGATTTPATPDRFTNAFNCLITNNTTSGAFPTGAHSFIFGQDPLFVKSYYNVYQASSKGAAFGNFVNVYFTPIGLMTGVNAVGPVVQNQLYGDYHLSTNTSPAVGAGASAIAGIPSLTEGNLLFGPPHPGLVETDYDGQARGPGYDIGADQQNAVEIWFPF